MRCGLGVKGCVDQKSSQPAAAPKDDAGDCKDCYVESVGVIEVAM